MRLLLASARKTLRAVDSERIAGLCRGPLDWQIFLALVDRHRVAPLVWNSLTTIDEGLIPSHLLQRDLRQRVERNTCHALMHAAELVRLVRLFECAGIAAIPLKGPVLAIQAYGSLALRDAGDLDLLVDPASVQNAGRILADAGYVRTSPRFTLSPGQAAAYMKMRKDFSYTHAGRAIHLELHWRWSQNACLFPLSTEEVWRRRESVQIGDSGIAAMPREELLLYQCAHGAHTAWSCLKWVCDIPALIGDGSAIDMPRLMSQARDLGVSRMLAQGLLLAHRLLDMPLLPSMSEVAHPDRAMRYLVSVAVQALTTDERSWTPDNTSISGMAAQVLYRLRLRSNIRYKLHNAYFYSLWTDDWRLIRVPARLWPLYFVLRPLLWIIRQLRKPQEHVM